MVESLLNDFPTAGQRSECLYVLAVALRYQDRLDEAIDAQSLLIEHQPDFARVYQERGHTLMSRNELTDAQRAYEKAVNLNPALAASWKALLNLYQLHDRQLNRKVGKHQARAKAALEYLLSLPEELVTVNSYLHENKLFEADKLCRYFLRSHKQHIEGMRLLAQILERTGVLTDAEFLLETALELAPDNHSVRFDHANLMLKMQKFGRAFEQTTRLLEIQPEDPACQALHANACAGVGEHAQAIELYSRVIEANPGQNALLVMRGHAQKTIGRLDDAVRSYRQAYNNNPAYGDAYWSLANTKSYRFTDHELKQMQTQAEQPASGGENRIHLYFALGKAFEDRGKFAESFTFYEKGNSLKQASARHKPEYLAIRTSEQIRVCTTALFDRHAGCGFDDPAPIFVVGLPRAGSTLIEQILASHSQVDGTMELPDIISLVQRLRGGPQQLAGSADPPKYPAILDELAHDYFERFGRQYIDNTQIHRRGAPFFIDKNPNNFFHVGLIRLILPRAKIIDARRHPMSCCFSGFKQLFGHGQEFSYGLHEIGNYYREYVELMAHWDNVLPGFVLRVQHEALVDDLEGQVRRMLEFCGLPFEQACVEYHKTERSVRTPSSEQVRQPIFRSSLDTWRNYEAWLTPLKRALGHDLCRQYGIEPAP